MDRRNWPWKKKSFEKTTNEKLAATSESVSTSLSSLASMEDQENYKKVNYVQIPMDSYKHFTGLENQVSELKDQTRLFEDEVKELKEQLSAAHHEINTKENLVLQHAKVAEEAVSGWEKADAESSNLKRQLESVTILKVTAEQRASQLDDALKECTRQIRNSKEESEQRLHDILLAKTIHWDKIKLDLEGKIDELNQGLQRAAAENAAFSRSLQERSNLIARFSEEKSRAEAEIELLKCNIKSYEKEISALKYDLHVSSKELEIRNEEKNMSLKSAEKANKQHLEGVKKIAKLEAECQRLRCLLRKKLPGPAALAQMKLEAENLGREFTDSRSKGDTVQNLSTHVSSKPEISIDQWEGCKRENELLTSRLLALEEETKTLKESLAARNSELQVSRNLCAKTLGKVKSLEAQIQMLNQQKDSPKPSLKNPTESPSSRNDGYPSSATSISEDGFDEDGSSMGSRAPLSSDSCKLRIRKSVPEFCKLEKVNNLELMDDFLEVERLAAYAADGISVSSTLDNSRDCKEVERSSDEGIGSSDHHFCKASTANTKLGSDTHLLVMLRSRIYRIFESQIEKNNMKKVLEDIMLAIQETEGFLPDYASSVSEVAQATQLSSQDTEHWTNSENISGQDLDSAVSNIHQFVVSIINEDPQNICGNKLRENLQNFSASVNKFRCSEEGLAQLVLNLSGILSEASDMTFGLLGYKLREPDYTGSDCVDKVALLEIEADKSGSDPSEKMCLKACPCSCHSFSEIEGLKDHLSNSLGAEVTSFNCLLKELERLKSEKSDMELNLARLEQDLGNSKSELQGLEQLLLELKSQLASSKNLHSLAETQLKCVTESYKSLEVHTQELESQVKHLQKEKEDLEIALFEEKQEHANAQAQCKDLRDKLHRSEMRNSSSAVAHVEPQARQENDIADAAEKLAACQETIYLLGKQLQVLQSRSNNVSQSQADDSVAENQNQSFSKSQEFFCQNHSDQAEVDSVASNNPSDVKPSLSLRSMVNPTQPSLTLSKSTSFSSSSKAEDEKHTRGLGRFFSSRGNNGHSKK